MKPLYNNRLIRLLMHGVDKQLKHFYLNHKKYLTAMIGLTYKCQCTCFHCGIARYSKEGEELRTAELCELFIQLASLGATAVYFIGGEPLLRDDLFILISAARKSGLATQMDTNGYFLTLQAVRKLKETGLDKLGVSLDSIDANSHDAARGVKGIFERAAEGIRNCVQENLWCYISAYATKERIENGMLAKIIMFAKQMRVNQVKILSPIAAGNWLWNEEIRISNKEKIKIRSLFEPGFVYFEDEYCNSSKKRYFYVSPYGDIQPCVFNPYAFGNIRTESVNDIVRRMWRHPMFHGRFSECPMNNTHFRNRYIKTISPNQTLPIREK